MKPLIGDGTGDAAVKPVFLTKAQRELLALQRSREEIQNQKKRQRETRSSNSESDHNFASHRDRKRNRSSSNSMRKRECKRVAGAGDLIVQRLKLVDRERETIKEQYLGSNKLKKRVIIKPSDKFRFSFDWDYALEDTYRDVDNSLYRNPHEAQLLFGRGFRAGMDRREQKRSQQQREIPRDLYDTFDTRLDNRHWSEKKVEEMKDRDWRIFREDFNISYKGSKIPKPMRNWGESKLSPELLKAVERVGYKKPSPIQMASIPLGLQQRDVIGIAQTGSGKTAAFVLPMLDYIIRNRLSDEPMHNVMSDQDKEGPCALVLAPTRELAQQIEVETNKFARNLGVNVVSIVGGQSIEEQGVRIRKGCEVVIATPGRLNDCLDNFKIVLNQCNYVVLDEADRMMDMGFESQVVRILNKMPSTNLKPENVVEEELCGTKIIYRTTYMFSATMVPGVERLVRKYLRNPVVVTTIGTSAGKAITNDLISQGVYKVKEAEKLSKLQRLLDGLGDDHKTAIVFVKTRSKADTVAKNLEKASGGRYSVTCFHGGKSQEQREISLEGFRNKRHSVLVATDIAGRGIDIPDVAHVINYDMPKDIEVYTHRIGRTGRAGKTGVATTFLTPQDEDTPVSNEIKQMAKRHVCRM